MWHFLQPAVVGVLAVTDRSVAGEDEPERGCGEAWRSRQLRGGERQTGRRWVVDEAPAQTLGPEGLEVAPADPGLPGCAQQGMAGLVRAAEPCQKLMHGARVIQRRYRRLHQRGRAVEGASIAPLLEGVAARQVPAAMPRGLVTVRAEMQAQRHAFQGRGEAQGRRGGIGRVAFEDYQRLDVTLLSRLGQLGEGARRRQQFSVGIG